MHVYVFLLCTGMQMGQELSLYVLSTVHAVVKWIR